MKIIQTVKAKGGDGMNRRGASAATYELAGGADISKKER